MEATIVPFLDAQGRAEPVRRTARTDVTALKEIEASTRALVENVFRPDYVIEDLNPAAERIFGYRREELGGRDRLIQVVVNLLSNAIKFSPPGSRVRVEARRAGDDVGVSVSDEGRGVPPALRSASPSDRWRATTRG